MKDYEHLIGWSDLKNFPWDVILLGGGSLAVAYGFEVILLSILLERELICFTILRNRVCLLGYQLYLLMSFQHKEKLL